LNYKLPYNFFVVMEMKMDAEKQKLVEEILKDVERYYNTYIKSGWLR